MFTKAVVALALTGTALAQTFSIATPVSHGLTTFCQPSLGFRLCRDLTLGISDKLTM